MARRAVIRRNKNNRAKQKIKKVVVVKEKT